MKNGKKKNTRWIEMSKTTEFMKKVLFEYENSLRQTGRTEYLVKKARETNSIIVCHNFSWARMLSNEYGVDTITLETYLSPLPLRGKKNDRKYLFDSPAEFELIMKKLEEAEYVMENMVQGYGF
jgi:hypothetical protein